MSKRYARTSGLYLIRCGSVGVLAQAAFLVGLVVLEVALEPLDVTVALERR